MFRIRNHFKEIRMIERTGAEGKEENVASKMGTMME